MPLSRNQLLLKTVFLILITLHFSSCSIIEKRESLSEAEQWKLGWRLISSNWDENYKVGAAQFDSLLSSSNGKIESKFLINGFEILEKLDEKEKIVKILNQQDSETLQELCNKELFQTTLKDVAPCANVTTEKVTHPELQLELIKLYVDDQASRGNIMEDVIERYNLNINEVSTEDMQSVDFKNRERLKEIIEEHGFPTKEMVGKEAMWGVFMIIQHSDHDKEWQKSQLTNIERAVERGDMEGQSYAYLYDRKKINAGEKQRYGTQFSNVDREKKIVELAETEDVENLDQRRMEVGMMPIEMYKDFILMDMRK